MPFRYISRRWNNILRINQLALITETTLSSPFEASVRTIMTTNPTPSVPNSLNARLQSRQSKRNVLSKSPSEYSTNERLLNKFSKHLLPEEIEKFRAELKHLDDNEKKCVSFLFKLIYEKLRGFLEVKENWDETKKRNMTNKALAFLSEFRDDYDINYQYKPKNFTLLHKSVETRNVTFVRFILFLYKNADLDVKTSQKDGGKTPLDFAIYDQNAEIIAALEAFKTSTDESRDVRDFCASFEVLASKNEIFMGELQNVLKQDKTQFDSFMNTLTMVMKRLVYQRKPFSNDMLCLATQYELARNCDKVQSDTTVATTQEEESKDGKPAPVDVDRIPIHRVLSLKMEEILDIDTLYKSDCNFYWFRQNFMKNPLWLMSIPAPPKKSHPKTADAITTGTTTAITSTSPTSTTATTTAISTTNAVRKENIYKELFRMIRRQGRKDTSKVREAVQAIIDFDKDSYKRILKYHYKKDRFKKKTQQRQDEVDDGLRAQVKEYQLVTISLFSSDAFFNASQMYDLDTYLSNLIIRAHLLDKPFQDTMLSIYNDDPTCTLFFGPVKTLKRCKEKAQMDYHKFPFPSSAQVIDMVRSELNNNKTTIISIFFFYF
ncbi:hypothetical protein RFI_19185 [Reticulomyxa filosa]|uniref:Uncharacterized protein n=1 Tax=Reticulomyxa filosa TaxID=46433 RepID=X6MWT5_RETFI|nr:hypothetical protein RFI_19185 [Reticulomyxa filosa]|eukprot:ETO18106.1 hypothetical protein RFI_19185 [Reticulomyxa filosa]